MSTELHRIAREQFMVLTRPQALAAGLSDKAIRGRLRTGVWRRLYPGVYDLSGGMAADTPEREALAATLAAGAEAVASHDTAATVWRLLDEADGVHVTVPPNRHPRLPGIVVHRRPLRSYERTVCRGVPLTTPATTLVGLAERSSPHLPHALDEALRRDLVDGSRMLRYLQRQWNRSRAGSAALRALLHDRAAGVPESWLETEMLELLRRWRLPEPQRQYRIELNGRPRRMDFAYPDEKIAIQVDGAAFHDSPNAVQQDKEQDIHLQNAGWRILRFTWRQINHDEAFVAFEVAKALALRPTAWTKPAARSRRARSGQPRSDGSRIGTKLAGNPP